MNLSQEIKRYLTETYSTDAFILTTPELATFFRQQTQKSLQKPPASISRPSPAPIKPSERRATVLKKAEPTPAPSSTPPSPVPVPTKREVYQEVSTQKSLQQDSFEDLKKIMRERFPKQSILEKPMTQEEWKKRKSHDILILHEECSVEQKMVLENLTAALNSKLASTLLLEFNVENREMLKEVKLIVAEEQFLQKNESLFSGMKTFTLDPIQDLIDQPNKKIGLWNALCKTFAN